MALGAIGLIFYVKRLLSIVAFATKSPLGQLAHIHFIGSLGHLENVVMTAGALQALRIHMHLVAENNGLRTLGMKRQISASNLLRNRDKGNRQNAGEEKHKSIEQCFFHYPPLLVRFILNTASYYSK